MENNTLKASKQKDLYQISLKLILKNDKDEVLILNAIRGGTFEGFHDLPGGRIDVDEFRVDFEDVLRREVKEELGDINVDISMIPVSTGRHLIPASLSSTGIEAHVLYLFFDGRYLSGEIKISEEHWGYKWVNLKEIVLEEYFNSGILEGVKKYVNNIK